MSTLVRKSRAGLQTSRTVLAVSATAAALALVVGCTPSAKPTSSPTPTDTGSPNANTETATVYRVSQEGLTRDRAGKIADMFKIPDALAANGAFDYLDPKTFAKVPTKQVGTGVDEAKREVVSIALDSNALAGIKPVSDASAQQLADSLVSLAELSTDMKASPKISHTTLTLSDDRGNQQAQYQLDTTVSYSFTLGGLAVTGQGARLRLTVGADGTVTQLSHALRKVEPGDRAPVISVAEAAKGCANLYGSGVQQATPTLGYQFPELAATNASGQGRIRQIYPQYTCHPKTDKAVQAERLLPAVVGSAPAVKLTASRAANKITATVRPTGGAQPDSYAWSTTSGQTAAGDSITYELSAREAGTAETITVEVRDVNGLGATATLTLAQDGTATADSVPGGGGFGPLTLNRLDAGIENTVADWPCAQESAQGFHDVMSAHATTVQFDWRGNNAWESDFRDDSLAGHDSAWVDDVDIQWYTGHGNPDGFTFTSSHDDGWITPDDARWGNRDLEWLQLESCSVLADLPGSPAGVRWGPGLQGLHILNGFHTSAYCVGGGTGRTFAENLFPRTFLFWTSPPMKVQQAWASMAIAKEPTGVVYRSVGRKTSTGVTNIDDYFWGQGPTGPDIAGPSGYWSISGTV
jgi:Family of unknown function (DUF6345)